jgi:CRISPR-associated protein Csx10
MSGVYLFSTQNPELWYDKLAELTLWGVGDRTSEGFGQIKICDEFHLIFRENAV